MKIIHISDLHVKESNYNKLSTLFTEIKTIYNLKEYTVIITGDLTDNNNDEHLDMASSLINLLKDAKNLLITAGNHDYFEFFGNAFWSCKNCMKKFNKKFNLEEGIEVLVSDGFAYIKLDSAHPEFFASGKLGKAQLIQLESVLRTINLPTIIYLHHHPFNLNYKWWKFWKAFGNKTMKLVDSKKFLKIIKGKNVVAVLCGHRHSKLGRYKKVGIDFFNGGSTSGNESKFGVSLIKIENNKILDYKERWKY